MSDIVEKKVGDLTVRIDRPTCIGTGACIHLADGLLEFDEEGVVAFRKDPEEIERDAVIEACRSCPVEALYTLDANGEQIVP